jgi:hypothetical protein
MNRNEIIKIGDNVKIIAWGRIYSSFQTAAIFMKLKKFVYGYNKKSHKDTIYTVINTYSNNQILAITDEIVDLIIGVEGVEKIILIPRVPEEPQLFDINNLYPYTD